ncbi:CBS domain-containing protein [Aureimonas populi]|uniref:CBS domain-containing protein n=1 Tax=Aureimonas populi TaxID=1701758 RepID=A0ABW5CMB1_9HYPH|nr:CBS domain-containing protein [Aureimonas populi]
MTIRHILNAKGRDILTVLPSASVADAARMLCERKIGALPIIEEGGRLAGILSERDVVRLVVSHGAEGLSKTVSEVMTRDVVTGREEMTLNEAMEAMTRGRFRHLPICDEDRLVGIISIGDAVKRRIEDVEREAEELRTYIHAG